MKVPVFEEIQLNQVCSQDYIEEKFSELGIGDIPIYIRTDRISREDFLETLPNIEAAVKNLGIHPRFPYPLVIMTKHIQEHEEFIIVESEEDLPRYFKIRNKRLSKKELQVLGKIHIEKNKMNNLFSYDSLKNIKKITQGQRELYNLSKELHFYEFLTKKMFKPEEKKNGNKKR